MFTRNAAAEPKALGANRITPLNTMTQPETPTKLSGPDGERSIIGNDLTIIGQDLRILTKGSLQIDGEIQGDIHGLEVIVGEKGKVTGTVAADTIIVRGEVAGVIRGQTVTLEAHAKVEGDIHHQALSIEQGASFDGRSRRAKDAAELKPLLPEGPAPKPAS
jgi:cytoskeletal protein CcmA (bactofilin family)